MFGLRNGIPSGAVAGDRPPSSRPDRRIPSVRRIESERSSKLNPGRPNQAANHGIQIASVRFTKRKSVRSMMEDRRRSGRMTGSNIVWGFRRSKSGSCQRTRVQFRSRSRCRNRFLSNAFGADYETEFRPIPETGRFFDFGISESPLRTILTEGGSERNANSSPLPFALIVSVR